MRKNHRSFFIPSLILTMTLALSAPMMAAGSDISAAEGDTGAYEDALSSESEEVPEEGWTEDGEALDAEPEETKVYTVTYSMNGRGDSWEEEVEEGDYAQDWAEGAEADGYAFTGWYTDKDCGSLWDSSAPITSDTKVYAGWEKLQEEAPEENEAEDGQTEIDGEETGESPQTETDAEDSGKKAAVVEDPSKEESGQTDSAAGADTGSDSAGDGAGADKAAQASGKDAGDADAQGTESKSGEGAAGEGATTGATLPGETKDTGKIAAQPQNISVKYPEGAVFEVTPADENSVRSYQWSVKDGSKWVQLEGTTAKESMLYIPSTTKNDNGRCYRCELTFKDGSKMKTGEAKLTITNPGENKPVLYVGNYAIDPSIDPKGKAYLDLSTAGLGSGRVTFDKNSGKITLMDVNFSNAQAPYDHKLSPAVGLLLTCGDNREEKYVLSLIGTNVIGIEKRDSAIDQAGSTLRFQFDHAKESPTVEIRGDYFRQEDAEMTVPASHLVPGTLQTTGGKTAIVSDADLDLQASLTIRPKEGDSLSNGIECKELTLKKGSVLDINAYGTAVYTHDDLKMEPGSEAAVRAITSNGPLKKAVIYADGDVKIDGASLAVTAGEGKGASVKTFTGLISEGDLKISDNASLKMNVNAPGNAYGIRAGKEFSLKDSELNVKAESSDGKGKTCGVLCGSASISLSKEKTYIAQSVATDGIAFAALTGKSGKKAQGYQENYSAGKISFETAEILVPTSGEISTGSLANESSGYRYVETIYRKGETAAPATGVRFESNNHEWGDVSYTWSEDNKVVKAVRTCKNYSSHVESEIVGVTARQTKAPTCTAKGQTTYTASFKNSGFKEQTKTVENLDALGHKFGEWTVTKKATLSATGIRQAKCDRCGQVKSETIPVLEKGIYKVTKGENLTWAKGSGKTLTIKLKRSTKNSEAFSHFQGILVDGKVLNKKYYSAKSGSVIITFKSDLLEKLATGSHTLTFGFEDGDNPTSKLTIQTKAAGTSTATGTKKATGTSASTGKGPISTATGDNTNIILWVLVLGVSAAAILVILRARKKKDGDESNSSSAG